MVPLMDLVLCYAVSTATSFTTNLTWLLHHRCARQHQGPVGAGDERERERRMLGRDKEKEGNKRG
jgi:hypothetical protein